MTLPTIGTRLPRRAVIAVSLALPLLLGGVPATAVVPAATPRTAPTTHEIQAITYNVGDGPARAKSRDLRRLMRLEPDVIGLQEVADREDLVTALAQDNGYRAVYEDASHHNAILLPESTEILAHGAIRISPRSRVSPHTPGSSDGWHPAKYTHWVRFRTDGLAWVAGVVHLVPSASRFRLNKELHHTQVANSADWFDTRPFEPLLMGDFNAPADSGLMADMREVATYWTKPSHDAEEIDHLWSKDDATGEVSALDGPDYSSDHRPVRAVLEVTR